MCECKTDTHFALIGYKNSHNNQYKKRNDYKRFLKKQVGFIIWYVKKDSLQFLRSPQAIKSTIGLWLTKQSRTRYHVALFTTISLCKYEYLSA